MCWVDFTGAQSSGTFMGILSIAVGFLFKITAYRTSFLTVGYAYYTNISTLCLKTVLFMGRRCLLCPQGDMEQHDVGSLGQHEL